jgi:hypothetical protein
VKAEAETAQAWLPAATATTAVRTDKDSDVPAWLGFYS